MIIILIVSVGASVFLLDHWDQRLTLTTTMLSGLCGLATFYIAILLYDRYGVESTTHQKSVAAIDELLDEMQKIHFILGYFPKAVQG